MADPPAVQRAPDRPGPEPDRAARPRRASGWLPPVALLLTTAVAGWFIVAELPDRFAPNPPAPPAATQSAGAPTPTALRTQQGARPIDYPTFAEAAGLALTGAAVHSAPTVRLADGAQRSGAMWSAVPLNPKKSFSTAFQYVSAGRSGALSFVLQAEGPTSRLPLDRLRPRLTVDLAPVAKSPTGRVTVTAVRTGPPVTQGRAATAVDLGSGPVTVWIDYSARSQTVRVFVSTGAAKPAKPVLTAEVDLARTVGAGLAYPGFAAFTADAVGTHDVLAWFLSGPA
ncbi:L-type lectin family protein [Micromonospora rubida]|uniref:hypothetical protein n=1 Tax=Micromonospora rubida TaxID=2697657 RepID=UPI001378C971|nr:hypothetical protein [Micromonospora rubida]NBE83348.1 hypothetical protein [Micromonospora rubida]